MTNKLHSTAAIATIIGTIATIYVIYSAGTSSSDNSALNDFEQKYVITDPLYSNQRANLKFGIFNSAEKCITFIKNLPNTRDYDLKHTFDCLMINKLFCETLKSKYNEKNIVCYTKSDCGNPIYLDIVGDVQISECQAYSITDALKL